MPNHNSVPVQLQIALNPTDNTWTSVLSNTGVQYYYLFTGGDDNMGGLVTSTGGNPGPCLARVRLNGPNRYEIVMCDFDGDVNSQLAWKQKSKQHGAILNWNEQTQTAYYSIFVKDTQNHCLVICDPGVRNQPVPPALRAPTIQIVN